MSLSDQVSATEIEAKKYLKYGGFNGIDGEPVMVPDLRKLERYDRSKLPPYLFRAFSSRSRGLNSHEVFQSAAQKACFSTAPPLRLSSDLPKDIALQFQRHLTWDCSFNSPFISFTNSLLLCMSWASRQSSAKRRRDRHEGIKIAIVETALLHPSQTIIPARLLQETIKNIPEITEADIPRGSYDLEFLAYGTLQGPFRVADFDNLKEHFGSYLPPTPSAPEDTWGIQFRKLRDRLFRNSIHLAKGKKQEAALQLASALSAGASELFLQMFIHVLMMTRQDPKADVPFTDSLITHAQPSHLLQFFTLRSIIVNGYTIREYAVPSWVQLSLTGAQTQAAAVGEAVCARLQLQQAADLFRMTGQEVTGLICSGLRQQIDELAMLCVAQTMNGSLSNRIRTVMTRTVAQLEIKYTAFLQMPLHDILSPEIGKSIGREADIARECVNQFRQMMPARAQKRKIIELDNEVCETNKRTK